MTNNRTPETQKLSEVSIGKSFDPTVDEVANVLLKMSRDIKKDKQAVMIIIDGPAGVGKSTFSSYFYKQLKTRLNGELTVNFLPQDLFGLSRSARIQLDVHPCADSARDAGLFSKLDQIIERESIKVPRYDSVTGERKKDVDTIESADVIVYEGVSSLGLFYPGMKHQDHAVFRIFVQPENDEVLQASRQLRDEKERNISLQEFDLNWQESKAHNWIYTFRGREDANLTLIRTARKTNDGAVFFELKQVEPIVYQNKEYQLSKSIPFEPSLKKEWRDERNKKLTESPQKEVYERARTSVESRDVLGKERAKQKVFTEIYNKQGLGSVVALIGNMRKNIKRDSAVYKKSDAFTESKYAKLVLDTSKPKNTFNPSPRFAFQNENEKPQESVILNVLEPSTAENKEMFGLSNLELVLTSEAEIRKHLQHETKSSIEKVISYQKQLKEFYNPRQYFTFEIANKNIAAIQPTSAYFDGQVLFADLRGKVPSFLQAKNQILKSKGDLPTTKHKGFFESSDADSFLMRRRDLTLEEAKKVRSDIIDKMKQVKGTKSQTDVALMMGLLKTLKPGDMLGQNSPSAITDENATHIQCFKENQSGELPIFRAERKKITDFSGGAYYELKYPVTAFLFELNKIDEASIQSLKNMQDKFLALNADLKDKDKNEIALISRKNQAGKFEIIFMLRKDLHYHQDLVNKTAQEVLVEATSGSKPIYNKRPGFLELAGGFLQDNPKAYEKLTDEAIDKMLHDYSAGGQAAHLFKQIPLKNLAEKKELDAFNLFQKKTAVQNDKEYSKQRLKTK